MLLINLHRFFYSKNRTRQKIFSSAAEGVALSPNEDNELSIFELEPTNLSLKFLSFSIKYKKIQENWL